MALSVKCGQMDIVGFVNSVIVVENQGTININTDYKDLTWFKVKDSVGKIIVNSPVKKVEIERMQPFARTTFNKEVMSYAYLGWLQEFSQIDFNGGVQEDKLVLERSCALLMYENCGYMFN